MFAVYNFSNFPPIVQVDLSGTVTSDEDFTNFTQEWLKIYDCKTNFEFIFNTKDVNYIELKYCFYIILFIKELKNNRNQNPYLKKSTIKIYNKYIFNLFKFIFSIQKPSAPVNLILIMDDTEPISEYISN